jgi:hypothetical protein
LSKNELQAIQRNIAQGSALNVRGINAKSNSKQLPKLVENAQPHLQLGKRGRLIAWMPVDLQMRQI